MAGEHPLRVGVTGHRSLPAVDAVIAAVDIALTRLAEAHPGRRTLIVSSLAEGADRLVARRALDRYGAALIAVLPFAPSEYANDFASPESRTEFAALLERADEVIVNGAAGPREARYEAAGRAVLDRSDVLIAVWDGAPARGRGGTAEIVSEARARRLPLAWVRVPRAAGARPPAPNEPAAVTFERL